MKNEIIIRRIQEQDCVGISEVENEAYSGHGYDFYFIRMIPYIFSTTCLIAEDQGKVAGYCLGAIEDCNPVCGWILSLAVKADVRNQGLGLTLLRRCMDLLHARGVKRIKLTVAEDNPAAVHLYQNSGFNAISTENDFFGSGQHRLLMIASS